MNWKLSKNIMVYVIIFSLIFSFIPFNNFVAMAEKTNDKHIGKRKPIELIKKRTATSKTFDNLDDTYTTEVSQQQIHFLDDNGEWKDINNNLVEKKKNKVQNAANEYTVEFNKTQVNSNTGFSIFDKEYKINMKLFGIKDNSKNKNIQSLEGSVKGIINDNTITYANTIGNADIVYTVGADRVKEDIIYSERPEQGLPQIFTYQVELNGLEVQQIEQAIYLVDPVSREKKYLIEAPYMYDANIPEGFIHNESISSIPEEAKSYNIKLDKRVEDGQLFIDLIPDAVWLNDANRQYPITIDPTIIRLQGEASTVDTTIRSAFPTQTGGNDNELGVGTAKDGNIVRSLLKFDLSAIPAATTIVSADLNLWFTSTNSSTPIDINLQKVTKQWEENEASWTYSKSTPYTRWATAGGDYAGTKLSTVSGLTSPPALNEALINWNVPVSVVQTWLTDPTTNLGFLLKSTNESTKIYKKFASSEQEVPDQYKPRLVITYKTTARLGLEDYWDYASHDLVDGTNYVNLTTLNNILQYSDLSIIGYAGFGLDFTRTYNSKDYEKSAFGYGWTFTGDEKIFINTGGDKSKVQYKDSDGTIHVFSYDEIYGIYHAPPGNLDKLKRLNDSTFILTDPYGYQTTFIVRESTKDTDVQVAYITSQDDRNGNTIDYQYDGSNRLIAIYTNLGNELGKKLTLSYNSSGLINQAKYNDQEINYGYTASGYLNSVSVKKSSDTRANTQFEYINNRISAVVDANGNRLNFAYTVNGDLESVTEPSVSGTASKTVYALDRTNAMAIVTSPEGEVTRYYVDDNYVINRALLPSGEDIFYKFNKNYQILEETTTVDGQAKTVKNTYDSNGNLLTTTDAENNVETYTYTAYQNIASYTDSTGAVSMYEYEVNGNLRESKIPSSAGSFLTSTYEYDENGELIRMTTSDGVDETYSTDYSVSPIRRTTTHKDTFDNITKTETDLNGNVVRSIDGKSKSTDFTYNLKNELTAVTVNNQITNYSYDGNGNLVNVKNPLGYHTNYSYNGQNQITSETNAEGKVTTYTFNANGDLTEIKKADNQTIRYGLDEVNNSSSVSINGVEKFKTIREGTDTLVEDKATQSSVRYQYYDNNLLHTVKFNEQSSNAIHYTYNGDESIAKIMYGGNAIDRQVDNAQNMTSLKLNGETKAQLTYNNHGLLKNVAFKDNVVNITKAYKKETRLDQESFSIANSLWKTFTYGYDENHNITSISSGEGKVTYQYDALNQLESEIYSDGTEIYYTYDAAGNRTSKKVVNKGFSKTVDYSFNKANQLKSVNGQAYEVDANGNLINDGKFRYEWNAFDQLTKVMTIAGGSIAEYRYDDQGRRVYSNTSNGETYYRYNGTSNQVLFEEDASGSITKAYTYDDKGNLLTMVYQGETYYYLTNYRGDVLALVNETGERVATYTYDAWGNILSQSGQMASENPYRYAGYRYDEETKLYYLMARYYNSDTGVFLSEDPVRGDLSNPTTLNGYNYSNNNPVMNIDRNGNFSIRTSVLIKAIDALIVLIPGLYSINNLIKLGKIARVHNLLNGKKIAVQIELKKYFSRFGLKIAIATTVANIIVNLLLGILNSSIGSIVAWGLKKYFFKTYTIKTNKYLYWGSRINVEYIDFSKRK